jgi:hypothetical protein
VNRRSGILHCHVEHRSQLQTDLSVQCHNQAKLAGVVGVKVFDVQSNHYCTNVRMARGKAIRVMQKESHKLATN